MHTWAQEVGVSMRLDILTRPPELPASSVRVLSVLGQGSFGLVSKALFQERALRFLVAVKSLTSTADVVRRVSVGS